MSRILIIHRYFWPENIAAFAQALGVLARHHLARGDEVTVVCGQSREAAAAAVDDDLLARLDLRAFETSVDRGLSIAGRMRNAVRLLQAGLKAKRAGRWDLVYVTSYPPGVAFLTLLLGGSPLATGKSIYFVQDNHTYRVPTRVGKALFETMQRRTLRLASRVVTLSDDMRDELERLLPEAERGGTKVKVLPNFAAVSGTGAEARDQPKLRDIIYAGGHGPGQNLGLFIEAVAAIPPDRRPRVDFFGDGSEKKLLQSRTAELGLDPWIRFEQNIPRDAVEPETARARFGLVGARPDLFRYAFPSKLAAYGGAGVPALVMCDRDSRLAAWIESEGLGHAIGARDAGSIALALTDILAAPAHHAPGAVRAAAKRYFSEAEWLRGIDALLAELGIPPAAKKAV